MSLSRTDYLLADGALRAAPLLRQWGDLETRWMARQLARIEVTAPVFICGLARSGSTLLLNLLARADGVASHRYRDFPGIWTPIWWNRLQQGLGREQAPHERPHGDGIMITRESPEAFEEPIWQHFFPRAHAADASHVLDDCTHNPAFEQFFRDHIRKILLLRAGTRYLSKGNYNVTRIAYLARLFPDARFLVPIRHPQHQVASLVAQHRRFIAHAEADPRIVRYLQASGHYEFGPHRRMINTGKGASVSSTEGDEGVYAAQWTTVYGHVADNILKHPQLQARVMAVRHEDLCAKPADTLDHVLRFVGLRGDPQAMLAGIGGIRHGASKARVPAADNETCRAVAAEFGY